MLQVIREKFTGGFAIAILVLIGVPFLFFGINYNFIGSNFAAKVDGAEVSLMEFEQAYRNQVAQRPEIATASDEQRRQVRRTILDSLVREQLVSNYLSEQGYRIGDEQLRDVLQNLEEFQVDGEFDRDTYRDFLLARGLEIQEFEASQRGYMREMQLRTAILASAIVTPSEYRRYLNLAAEQRLVSLATLTEETVADEIEITDEMVTAFYENNPTLYQRPESVDVAYIRIDRAELAAAVQIDDAELAAYYEENKDRYLQDEQRQARHILILFDEDEAAAERQAEDILMRIRAGGSFSALAEEFSMDGGTSANGGDLGVLTRSQMPVALGDAVFSMDEGDLEGPVRSDYGYHIVRLDEIFERGPLPLNEVRGELVTELRDRAAEADFVELERQISDALFDAQSLESIAETVGVPVETIDGFTRSGGEPLGSNQAAIDAVFAEPVLRGGEISDIVELDATSSAVFQAVEYHEATRLPLDEVRDDVVAELRAQQADLLLAERAEQILAAVHRGEDFGAAAEAVGASVGEPRLLARQSEDVDQLVLFEVFAAKKPQQGAAVTNRVRNLDGSYTVYSLEAVLPGRPETIPLAQRDAGKLQLAQESGVGDYLAFLQALYEDADIVVNDDIISTDDLLQ